MVHFVGAGPGAVDLITLRGKALLEQADQVIYAGSLVNPELLTYCREDCIFRNSASMTLEEIIAAVVEAEQQGKDTVRLHTGDPSLYGAIREQMEALDMHSIPYDVTPGVSSFSAAAAALPAEFTCPEVSQTLILTRMAGRTFVPESEDMASLARHQASMAIFLSATHMDALSEKLMEGGYDPQTPVAVVYKASWPDQKVLRCTIETMADRAKNEGISRMAMILVGRFLEGSSAASKLYDASFTHMFRQGNLQ